MAATCSLAVRGLGETRPWRYVWAGSPPFGRFAGAGIRLVPLSHVIGAAFGAAAGAWSLAFAARGRPPARTS